MSDDSEKNLRYHLELLSIEKLNLEHRIVELLAKFEKKHGVIIDDVHYKNAPPEYISKITDIVRIDIDLGI